MKKLLLLGVLGMFLSVSSVVFADDVYVTPRGSKFHKETCRLVKRSKVTEKYELKDAKDEGYSACKRCFKKQAATQKADANEEEVIEETK